MAAKALIRAAELGLGFHEAAPRVEAYVKRLSALPDLPAELQPRIEKLKVRTGGLSPEPEPPVEPAYAPPPEAAPAAPPQSAQVFACRLIQLATHELTVESSSGARQVPLHTVVAVAAGLIPEPRPDAPGRTVLVTDLVLSWGQGANGPTVLRFKSATMGLSALYPGLPPRQAYAAFLAHVLEQSGATALPDRAALQSGAFPRFASEEELTRSRYAS